MQDRKVTPEMVPVIKRARLLKYNYARIASYFQINQGRIADVMKGRIHRDIPPAENLPPDFPSA
jgi:predicted XRE-type DNA-binding protein